MLSKAPVSERDPFFCFAPTQHSITSECQAPFYSHPTVHTLSDGGPALLAPCHGAAFPSRRTSHALPAQASTIHARTRCKYPRL